MSVEQDSTKRPDITDVGDIDLSAYDIDVSEPFGHGAGEIIRMPDRTSYEYAIGKNEGTTGYDERVAQVQRLLITEMDEGNTNHPSSVLPEWGVDGVWRCETQTAFNSLLQQKGVSCNSTEQVTCDGQPIEACQMDEETLEALKQKVVEEQQPEEVKEEEGTVEEKDPPKISDQCILISNVQTILEQSKPPQDLDKVSFYEQTGETRRDIKYKNIHKLRSDDPSTIMNKLMMTKGAFQFLNIRHWQLSQLVPVVRIYGQYPQASGAPPREVEMKFGTFVDPVADLQSMLNSQSQRGVGVGIESVTYKFIGKNPDTAKRQIQGTLNIYAQNFNELFKVRRGFDQDGLEYEDGYRIIDLVTEGIRPGSLEEKFSLKMIVGWGATGGGGILEPDLVNALKDTQLSMIVTVADYNINIMDEAGGGVRLQITFYPRLESVSLTTDADVLADENTRKKRKERKETFERLINTEKEVDPESPDGGSVNCLTDKEVMALKAAYDADIAKDIENSSQDLLKKLLESGAIYTALVKKETYDPAAIQEAATEVRNQANGLGLLNNLNDIVEGDDIETAPLVQKRMKIEVLEMACDEERLKTVSDFTETRLVNYFFLGDLIAVALNNVLGRPEITNKNVYYGNMKYMLGPIILPKPDGSGDMEPMNIGDIPISVDLFNDFLYRKLPKNVEFGTAWPLFLFTRQVIKELVFEALGPNCFDGTGRIGINLETATISADPSSDGIDPIEAKIALTNPPASSPQSKTDTGQAPLATELDLDKFRINFDDLSKSLFVFDSFNKMSLRDKYNYFIIYATNNKTTSLDFDPNSKQTRLERDFEKGIYHVTTGLDRGLVKSIDFSQQDASRYLRSARILESRNNPDARLANMFKVTVNMYGNNLFFPGSFMYLNPRGLGSDLLGDPGTSGTPANLLGIGGYHSIGVITNEINLNGFTTKLDATFFYSGSPKNQAGETSITPPEVNRVKCPDSFKKAMDELSGKLINNGGSS